VPGANGVFAPILVSKGAVVGTWKRVMEKDAVVVSAYPFKQLSIKERAGFGRAMRAYGKFFDAKIRISDA
ncbi:MAG: crosslink repair DNA glycosylase YcaQ family protein, partial [Polyangiaceae bacterium]